MANTDKFIKGARRFSTTIGIGGVANGTATTVPITTFPSDFTDGDAVAIVVDRVNTSGTLTPDVEEVIIGVKSGSNLINCLRGVEGTAGAHTAGAVVEIKLFKTTWNRLLEGILAEHNQDGTHSDITADSVTTDAITLATGATPTEFSIDGTLSGNSDTAIPTEKAVKTYVDANAGAGGKYVFIVPGTITTGTDVAGTWFVPDSITINEVDLYVDTAGATNSTTVDLNLDGTTIFTTQGNRPSLSDTATSDLSNVPDVTSATEGQKITLDVDAVTSTAPVDLYVVIKYS